MYKLSLTALYACIFEEVASQSRKRLYLFSITGGPHVDPQQQRRYSTPSSPTMYAYQQRPQGSSIFSSMSDLPEVRTYLHFMEGMKKHFYGAFLTGS